MSMHALGAIALTLTALTGCASGAPAARAVGEPTLELPTLHSLGVWWMVAGDDNRNARVGLEIRPAGATVWQRGMDLLRVEPGHTRQQTHEPELEPPAGTWLFAGSALLLEPDTAYELRLTLADPDGGAAQHVLSARTLAEPADPPGLRRRHVVPGAGGGSGTADDPFRGLAAAENAAEPGDLFLLAGGVYRETLHVTCHGKPGKPIIFRAAGDGPAVLEGGGTARYGVRAASVAHVWLEGLTLRGVKVGIAANDSSDIVIRRCTLAVSQYGINFNSNPSGKTQRFFVTDNTIEGPCAWPRSKGIEDPRGIQATGRGHVIAYNRIRGFADGIDAFGSRVCAAIDIHNNDLSEMTDDGIEMDFVERNGRCFRNRLTNIFQGISEQPVYGGPVYVFRNVLYNVGLETFKLHHNGGPGYAVDWAPSGVLFFHNTSVKTGVPLILWSSGPVYNCVSRNNLFVGTAGRMAYDNTAPMIGCDFDYDGFAGGPWEVFFRWNKTLYATPAQARREAPVYRNAVVIGPGVGGPPGADGAARLFADGTLPPTNPARAYDGSTIDLRLRDGAAAIDAGAVLPGVNDGFAGKAPDLGAYEHGQPLPHYGPRPAR